MRKIMMYSGIILGLILISFFIIQLVDKRERDQAVGATPGYADSLDLAANAVFGPVNSGDIVFIGTSITANWNLERHFDSLPVVNRGIHSNSITHIRKRLPAICRQQPSIIVLEGGINDLYNGKDKRLLVSEIKDIVDSILIISPKTQIYLTSILPVSSKGDSAKYNPLIREVNDLVSSMVNGARASAIQYPQLAGNVLNLHYVDYSNNMTEEMYTDDVHLSSAGYLTLKHILTPYIHESKSKNYADSH